MIIKNENGFGWGSFFMSILLILAGVTSFRSPDETLMTLGIFFGVIAIIQGFLSIVIYSTLSRVFDRKPWPVIFMGIMNLAIGIYFIMNPSVSTTVLPILFSTWFIVDSSRSIFIAFRLKAISQRWFWINSILGVMGLALGIFLLSNLSLALLSISTLISFYFFIAGAIKMIDAFV